MKKKIAMSLAGGLLSLAAAGVAGADTVTFNSIVAAYNPHVSLAAAIPQFDLSLGSLNSATVLLNVQVTPIVAVIDIGNTPLSFTSAFTENTGINPVDNSADLGNDVPLTWTDPYLNSSSATFSYLVAAGTAIPGINNYAGSAVPGVLNTVVPNAALGNYVGNSTYALNYTLNTPRVFSGGTDTTLLFGGDYSISGVASVTYDYTPIAQAPSATPLPPAAFAGLILLVSLGFYKAVQKNSFLNV